MVASARFDWTGSLDVLAARAYRRGWLGRLTGLVELLSLVPVGLYRDRDRCSSKWLQALERSQRQHAWLREDCTSLAARNRELLEELSLCREADHPRWRPSPSPASNHSMGPTING
jgi:hypothetical protein